MPVERESTALKAIEAKSQFSKEFFSISDPKVTIPLLWPRGTYGLPMPKSGCPKEEKGSGFVWHWGSRYHDTPSFFPVNEWSNPYDLAGFYGKENVQPFFCIKTQPGSSKFSLSWPKGEYCILKKGKCPSGKNLFIKAISSSW